MSKATQTLRNTVCVPRQRELVRGLVKGEVAESYRPLSEGYVAGVGASIERARLWTESFKQTESDPQIIRNAKALANVLDNITIYIGDEERIAGNVGTAPGALPIYPDREVKWMKKEFSNGYGVMLNEQDKAELFQILDYWSDKCVAERAKAMFPGSLKRHTGFRGVISFGHAWVYFQANYDKLFKVGLKGVMEVVEGRLNELNGDMDMPPDDYIHQKRVLQSMLIALTAAVRYIQRHAALARKLAGGQVADKRRGELEQIAEACEWVAENPPRSFYEAIQLYWLVSVIGEHHETMGDAAGDRLDQLLYPFYHKDLEQGNITRDEAQELIEFLLLKFEEWGYHLAPSQFTAAYGGGHVSRALTIGGVTKTGEDAVNEVSYIILDAAREMRTAQPSLELRYHDKIPEDFILKAIDVLHTGVGYPAFYNDKAHILQLLNDGITLEEARDYVIKACVDINLPGKNTRDRCTTGYFCVPKALELALNQGVDKFTGEQMGYPTPDPLTFISIEDVIDAYVQQVDFFVDKLVKFDKIFQVYYADYMTRPFASALTDGCIEQGKATEEWSYYRRQTILLLGPSNVADSLAVIKKLVFEDKKVSMKELLDALKNNWEGTEELRQMVIRDVPKYGNDNAYVDRLAAEVHKKTADTIKQFKDMYGYSYIADGSGTSANFGFSVATGATPDGRRDGDTYADAVLSPMIDRDTRGPTAVLKSASEIDPISYSYLLNQKFLPQFLEGDNKKLFASYLKTWADLGISHIQFNVVNRDTLIEAKENPDEYKNLVVRVAGYSAYFVDLSEKLQDLIIARTEQEL